MKGTERLHGLGQSLWLDFAVNSDPIDLLQAHGGDGEEVIAQFTKEGIDVAALAEQLQDEGAKSFINSWNDLIHVIEKKL